MDDTDSAKIPKLSTRPPEPRRVIKMWKYIRIKNEQFPDNNGRDK